MKPSSPSHAARVLGTGVRVILTWRVLLFLVTLIPFFDYYGQAEHFGFAL